ncbi:MAG: WYL domain-containing protein, partial [Nocardioidaceae bacterium]|nr:WYL domain-containing protein [Nocardioidaceae bacterium]
RAAGDQQGVDPGWERLEVTFGSSDAFGDEILGYGADVVLEEPAEIRGWVVRRLREAAGERAMQGQRA